MFCLSCGGLGALARAAAKSASARLRSMGALPVRADWSRRAEICERCPRRVIHSGVSYCGRPFLHQIRRDESTDGCGCPCHHKARDPHEHCPVTWRHTPTGGTSPCFCKWCVAA